MVKNPPAYEVGDTGSIPGSGRSPILRWKPTGVFLPGKSMTEVPGGLQSMGSQRVRRKRATQVDPKASECPLSIGRHLVAKIHNVQEATC